VQITQAGLDVLSQAPPKIDNDFLKQYEPFREFIEEEPEAISGLAQASPSHTPEELLESSYSALRKSLADELLERVKSCSPKFFERLAVDLLVAMGYGGEQSDPGQHTGRPGDGGIDGLIMEDKLGLDAVCLQAKRWGRTVGSPDVQGFVGSMEGKRYRKGVMLTTSTFSNEAKEYVKTTERKIVLIDGIRLAELMLDHDIGVAKGRSYVIKKLDPDYFDEEE
jgi:restriction system protein